MNKDEKIRYAQVIVDIPNLDTRTFSYLIPDELNDTIKIGLPVLVPFGNQGVVNAFVVGFSNYLPDGIKAKYIYEILDTEPLFDLEYLKFLEWVSNYYCCDLPTVIATAIPSNFFSKAKRVISLKENMPDLSKLSQNQKIILDIISSNKEISVSNLQKKVKLASSKFYEAIRKLRVQNIIEINNIIEQKNSKPKTESWIKLINKETGNKRYAQILLDLDQHGGKTKLSEFAKAVKTTYSTLRKLEQAGNVEIFDVEVYRNPLKIFESETQDEFLCLNFQQKKALERIKKALDENDTEPLLLYGITGSGKTEVYFHAAKDAIEAGKNVIFLAPEIALATMLAKRVTDRFGIDSVAIWHSNLSEGERFDVWDRIRNNKIKIIIGARSAVFAPIKNIGLMIIDEEHESSYKQTSPAPRYNAKDLAIELAKRSNAALVLGSATPDVVSYYRAINTNRVISLPERPGTYDLAKVMIIDMKKQINKSSVFSKQLINAIKQNLEEKKQSILLINRRGFSTHTICEACGITIECKKCSIPLIYHRANNKLRCHYCGFEQNLVTTCTECGSQTIKYVGTGTQKVEDEFRTLFPNAVAARLDSDVMTSKNAHIDIMSRFTKGDIDILIGTQMIAKGLDNPNVTLVGVLMSDSLFNMPDFRASERGFQLLTQVAGRAGRGDFKGSVYFQTYSPDFFALQTAKEQDYLSFYYSEIQSRYEFAYPPYSQLIRFILSSKNEIRTGKIADEIAYKLNTLTNTRGISERLEIFGPSPCIISKLKNEFRYQIIIKNRMGENGHFLITNYVRSLNIPYDIKFLIDVDPSDMF